MEILKEITEWDCPNHTYYVEGMKMYAYKIDHVGEKITFKVPITFYKKGRKFKVMN